MQIGNKLKVHRRKKRMRQKELAAMSGISNTYLSDIENNRTVPSLKTLVRLCAALDVDIKEMFD
jgi:transcriptional regulator with XRE-family HTH domain